MSKSLFGSVREKLSRKPSTGSSKIANMGRSSNLSNPFTDASATHGNGGLGDVPPPAYTASAPSAPLAPSFTVRAPPAPSSSSINSAAMTSDDDKYAFLSTFDTVFVIDDSGSMAGSSWREVATALRAITPICTAHDADGIDLYFLNHKSSAKATDERAGGGYYNITNASTVEDLFNRVRPSRATPTGARLQSILMPYVASLVKAKDMDNVKPVNIIVITDGCPSDDPEGIIVHHAKKLDSIEAPPYQVGIQFFQIGSDPGASRALSELDDDLADQGIRDMVDAVTWDVRDSSRNKTLTADGILKVVLGAVVRRLDRKPSAGGQRRRN